MTQQKPTGGQAFPRSAREGVPGNEWKGMTLRDYFAGQALAGLLAGARHHFPIGAPSEQIANAADDLADAMIAKRDA